MTSHFILSPGKRATSSFQHAGSLYFPPTFGNLHSELNRTIKGWPDLQNTTQTTIRGVKSLIAKHILMWKEGTQTLLGGSSQMAFVITDGPFNTGQISAESTCFHSGQRVHTILSLSAQQILRRWKKAENYRSDPCKITTSHCTLLGFRKHPLVRPQQWPGKVGRAGIISILTGGEMIDFKVKWLACTRSQVRQWRSSRAGEEPSPLTSRPVRFPQGSPASLCFRMRGSRG